MQHSNDQRPKSCLITIQLKLLFPSQGRNLLVTARKSTSSDNETVLWDHHRFPPPHFWMRHSRWPGDGWFQFLLSGIKPGGGFKCPYADIISTDTHSLLGSNPHPSISVYTNQSELSCNLLQLTLQDNHHSMIWSRQIL